MSTEQLKTLKFEIEVANQTSMRLATRVEVLAAENDRLRREIDSMRKIAHGLGRVVASRYEPEPDA